VEHLLRRARDASARAAYPIPPLLRDRSVPIRPVVQTCRPTTGRICAHRRNGPPGPADTRRSRSGSDVPPGYCYPMIRRLALVTLIAAGMTHAVTAQDWLQWRGPGRDGHIVGFR